MSQENLSPENKCASCPNRSMLSRSIAKLAMKPETVEGCDGYVLVSRGRTVSAIAQRGEPAPEGEWNCVSSAGDGKRRYTANEWEDTEVVCGRDEIAPRDGEVSYARDITDKKGHRWVTYISGEEQDVSMARFAAAMLLDQGDEDIEEEGFIS